MGFQKIPDVTIGKRGSPKAKGEAFGGWIHGLELRVGSAEQPTTISIDVGLDTQAGVGGSDPVSIDFDISAADLQANAKGRDTWDIKIGNKTYCPMYLISYEINGTASSKLLRVKFIDYSMVLDKINVCLFKRNGYTKGTVAGLQTPSKITLEDRVTQNNTKNFIIHSSIVTPEITAVCPSCSRADAMNWTIKSDATGVVEFTSHFLNYKGCTDTLFQSVYKPPGGKNQPPFPDEVLRPTQKYKLAMDNHLNTKWFGGKIVQGNNAIGDKDDTNSQTLTIDGGTLIIGSEEYNTTACGDLAPVTYSFSELLKALNVIGFKFTKIDSDDQIGGYSDIKEIDKNPSYRQSYIGTLREVLNNWCSDFALNFIMGGDVISFYNLSPSTTTYNRLTARDMSNIMIPYGQRVNKVNLGAMFNSDKDYAITNYTEKVDISDTYKQTMVTFNIKPRTQRLESKTLRNYCGFIAMHPLDFINPKQPNGVHSTSKGILFDYPKVLNDPWPINMSPLNISDPKNPSIWYSNRSVALIDVCAALAKHSTTLRNIFAGGLLAGDPFNNQFANCFSLIPLHKFGPDDEDTKLDILEDIYQKKSPDGQRQNYIIESEYFEMLICLSDEQDLSALIEWEKTIAENMYKYGLPVKANVQGYPFLAPNHTDHPGFFEGLEGSGSNVSFRSNTTTQPASTKYKSIDTFPFNGIFKSDLDANSWINDHIANLDTSWGTTGDFSNIFKFQTTLSECKNFGDLNNFTPDEEESSPASFKLEDFEPIFIDITDNLWDDLEDELLNSLNANPGAAALIGKILKIQSSSKIGGLGTNYTAYRCPKLKLMIIPKVSNFSKVARSCPHLHVDFNFLSNATNLIMERDYARREDQKYNPTEARPFLKGACDYSTQETACSASTVKSAVPVTSETWHFGGGTTGGMKPPYPYSDLLGAVAGAGGCGLADLAAITPLVFEGFTLSDMSAAARAIQINFNINPPGPVLGQLIIPSATAPRVASVDEDFPDYKNSTADFRIVYPIGSTRNGNNFYRYYWGEVTTETQAQIRSPEFTDFAGDHWQGQNNVAKINHINNEIQQRTIPQYTNGPGLINPIYHPDGQIIGSVQDYHDLVKSVGTIDNLNPLIDTEIEFAGDPVAAGMGAQLTPSHGLTSLSYYLTSEGFKTKVSFSTRAPKLPKKEAIINRVNSRF